MNISIRYSAFSLFFFVLLQSALPAASPRNLALHRKAAYRPDPVYSHSRHDNDPYILTDGVTDTPPGYWRGYRWAAEEYAVGWETADIIEIKIDLGRIYPVEAISVHTFCGRNNGIEFPEYIAVSGSLDGQRYTFAGFASTDGWEFDPSESILRVLRIPVAQRARHIKLYVQPYHRTFFATEIEVFEARDADFDDSRSGFMDKDKLISLVERARQLQRDSGVLAPRIAETGRQSQVLVDRWKTVEQKIADLGVQLTEPSLAKAEASFAQLRAAWFRAEYEVPWLCYPADPMDVLRYGDLPELVPKNVEIALYQWQDEYGAAAINLVNCSETEMLFSGHFSPLRSNGRTIDSADVFELRRGLFVRVPQAGLVTDPLVLQQSNAFPVAPGDTVQLWFDVDAGGLEPGIYTAALSIEARADGLEKERQVIPIQIEIADKQFPDKMPFYTYNWDYVRRADRFTPHNPRLAVDDLKRHHINVVPIRPEKVFVNNAWSPGKDRFSPDNLRAELQIRGMMGIPEGKNRSIVLLGTGSHSQHELRFGKYETPEFEIRYVSFLKHLIHFMLSNGYDYDSFAMYPFDEGLGWDFIYVATLIRSVDPNVRIFANRWLGLDEVEIDGKRQKVSRDKHFGMVKDLVDIWCPHLMSHILHHPIHQDKSWTKDALSDFKRFRDILIGEGKQVWSYYANIARLRFYYPEKLFSSKDYRGANSTAFRTMPIVAASLGMSGMGFWAYIHGGEDLWNLKEGQGGHSVVYAGAGNPDAHSISEFIIPSKRWRQWRLGVQDAVALMGHENLLCEFFKTPNTQLNSVYLRSLRKKADNIQEKQQ